MMGTPERRGFAAHLVRLDISLHLRFQLHCFLMVYSPLPSEFQTMAFLMMSLRTLLGSAR